MLVTHLSMQDPSFRKYFVRNLVFETQDPESSSG